MRTSGQEQPVVTVSGKVAGTAAAHSRITKMLPNWIAAAMALAASFAVVLPSAGAPVVAASGVRHKAHRHSVTPPSLCSPSEKDYFSCPVSRGRTISVCGAHDGAGRALVQYRVGVVGTPPEFVYPGQPSPASGAFEFVESGSAKSNLLNLRFESGGTTYVVYRFSASMSEQIDAGVAARSGSGPLEYTPCQASLELSRFSDMSELNVNRPDVNFDKLVFPPQ